MMSDAQHSEWTNLPPIQAKPNAVYNHGDDEFYHVGGAVAAIRAAPHQFKFGFIQLERLFPQLDGQGSIDTGYAASLSDEDAARPVLLTTYSDGSVRMIDGYHRATRARQLGIAIVGAWILTSEQTERFRMDADMVKRIGLTSGL